MSNGQHAFCPPSGADIWGKCPLFCTMNEANPHDLNGDTDATLEGTAAHEVFAAMVMGKPVPQIASNGVFIDDEMRLCAEAAADAVRAVDPDASLNCDSEERLPACGAFGPDVWGTPDLVSFRNGVLRIWDYKYGHRYVPAVLNEQLAVYAKLAFEALNLGPLCHTIELRILQPRCFGRETEREWITTQQQLLPLWDRLALRAKEARSDNPPSVAGDHCRYCPGRLACQANMEATGEALDVAERSAIRETTPAELSSRLSMVLRAKALIDAQHKALEAVAMNMAFRGERLPGFHVERTSGKERWADDWPPEKVVAFGQMSGLDLARLEAVSPAQARKRGANPELLKRMTRRTAGTEKLVEDDENHLNLIFQGETR